VGELITVMDQSLNKLLMKDMRKANEWYERIAHIRKFLPKEYKPSFDCTSGRQSYYCGRKKDAVRFYRSALRLSGKSRNYKSMARANWGLGFVYAGLGEYDKSIEHAKKALRYFRRTGNDDKCAMIMNNIGLLYHGRDNNRMAQYWIEKARDLKNATDPSHDHNLANIKANLGLLDEAAKYYKRAQKLSIEQDNSICEIRAEYGLAYIHFLKDEFPRALQIFESVADKADQLGDRALKAVTLLDLTEVNVHLNQYGSAITIGEETIVICREMELLYEEAKAEYFISRAFNELGEIRQARDHLNRASALFNKLNNKLWLGMTEVALAEQAISKGHFIRANDHIKASLRLLYTSRDERMIIDSEISLVESKLCDKPTPHRIRSAINLLDKDLVSYQRHRLLVLIGDAYNRRGNSEKAVEFYRRATDTVEKMVTSLRNDELGFFFTLDKLESFEKLVSAGISGGDNQFAYIQHLRSYSLLNNKVVPDWRVAEEIPPKLVNERSRILSRLRQLDSSLGDQRYESETASGHRKLEEKLWRIERKIRGSVANKSSLLSSKQSGSTAQPVLQSNEVLVSFADLDIGPGAFIATDKSVRYCSLPFSMRNLRSSIREYHFLMETDILSDGTSAIENETFRKYLRHFHKWLINPLQLPEKTERIFFLVDKEFSQIPYASLESDDEVALCEKCDIRYPINPGEMNFRSIPATISRRNKSSVFALHEDSLKFVNKETQEIKRLFPHIAVFSGTNATGASLREELSRSDGFVHIATHSTRASENPLFSRMLLSDGPLFPFDLMANGIKSKLVTLSGCQTAASGIYYGNSFSLAKAFYKAGSRFVLASLWLVSDRVSFAFMREFYTALSGNKDIPSAYRTALLRMREAQTRAALWSPFVLLGI